MRKKYTINWDKVETLEDVKGILKAMNIEFYVPPASIEGIEPLVEKANYE